MSKLIQKYTALKEATDLAIQQADGLEALASDILTNVVIHTINTYQQKLNVGVEDSVSDLIDAFKQKVAEEIFDTASGWKLTQKEPHLFPRGCRFCHSKGDSTVVVIEQDPQIRSLLFLSDMLGERGELLREVSSGTERIALAMPYVIFFVHFKYGEFANLYCGWRTTSLNNLHDRFCLPFLPNQHSTFNVCVGKDHNVRGTGIVEQSNSVINNYWQSQFNHDLSDQWWSKFRLDRTMLTGRTWAANTLEDPTFVLRLSYDFIGGKSVQEMLDWLTQHEFEPDQASMMHKLSESIDNSVGALFSKIMRYFKKTKFDKHHPKDIKDSLTGIIKSATGEFRDVVFAIHHEVQKLAHSVEESRRQKISEPRGAFWEDYSP